MHLEWEWRKLYPKGDSDELETRAVISAFHPVEK